MNAIEICARSGPKKLTKTYNKGFPNHSTLINYGKIPFQGAIHKIWHKHLILIAGDVSLGPMTTNLEYKWS